MSYNKDRQTQIENAYDKYKDDFIVKTLMQTLRADTPKHEFDNVEKQVFERIDHLLTLEVQ